jgi:hypothetical protein
VGRFRSFALLFLPLASACSLIVGLKDREPAADAGDAALDDGNAPDVQSEPPLPQACEAGVQNPDNDHCYAFMSNRLSWGTAESDCVTNWQGHLVSITTGNELTFIEGLVANGIKDASVPDGKDPGVWLGLQLDSSVLDSSTWTTGEPVAFQNFNPFPPNKTGCAFQYSGVFNDHWDVFQCNIGEYYVCERPAP